MPSVGAMVRELEPDAASTSARSFQKGGKPAARRSTFEIRVVSDAHLHALEQSTASSVGSPPSDLRSTLLPIRFSEHGSEGYVSAEALGNAKGALLDRPREALIFIHGYNCSLACALGRVAQICASGNMLPHIEPFVFSYAAGSLFSYLNVLPKMCEYADDFASFLAELAEHFKEVHIVCHSSGAEFFFTNFAAACQYLAPSRQQRESQRWQYLTTQRSSSRKLHLATLTLMNPDVLTEKVFEVLPDVMDYAEHFTTYNDCHDMALGLASVMRKLQFKLCRRVPTSRSSNQEFTMFGAVPRPLHIKDRVVEIEEESGGASGVESQGLVVTTSNTDVLDFPIGCGAWVDGSWAELDEPSEGEWSRFIDVIDCSCMEQNVSIVRHNYYMLNTQFVEDICELVGHRATARSRARLVQVQANVFHFLSPPSHLKE